MHRAAKRALPQGPSNAKLMGAAWDWAGVVIVNPGNFLLDIRHRRRPGCSDGQRGSFPVSSGRVPTWPYCRCEAWTATPASGSISPTLAPSDWHEHCGPWFAPLPTRGYARNRENVRSLWLGLRPASEARPWTGPLAHGPDVREPLTRHRWQSMPVWIIRQFGWLPSPEHPCLSNRVSCLYIQKQNRDSPQGVPRVRSHGRTRKNPTASHPT